MATAPDTTPPAAPGPRFWRGLEEWADTPEARDILAHEFPENADQLTDPVTRRQFVTLMGASLALAGAAGCSPRAAPNRTVLPYTRQPDRLTPGVPLYFATAMPHAGASVGLLVKSHEGRPVKVEGNPSHPASLGATDAIAQASILNLYDPDRSQAPTYLGEGRSWDGVAGELRKIIDARREKKGAGLRFLTEPVVSPTFAALMEDVLKELPEAKWVQWEPLAPDAARVGAERAFGKPLSPVYDFTKADVVLALDADFLSCPRAGVRNSRDFASRRKVRKAKQDGQAPGNMNRLYAVESLLTPTGAVADHRLPLKPSDVELFARALAKELGVKGAPDGTVPPAGKAWIGPLAKDLLAKKGKSLVVAGDGQPASLHALVHAINDALGNVGQTVTHITPPDARPGDRAAALKALVDEMSAGEVQVLFILGGNPVFTAPVDLKFPEALDKVPLRVHLGPRADETGRLCHYHIPEAHFLETWGDARAFDGTVAILQPLIAPLYGGKSALELVAAAIGRTGGDARQLVRATWEKVFTDEKRPGDFETFWEKSLQDGVIAGTKAKAEDAKLGDGWSKDPTPPAKSGGLEVAFRADPALYDGRFANNGWLQELPKPVSKITWDNVAFLGAGTAKKLGVKSYRPQWTGGEHGNSVVDVVTITVDGRSVEAPVWVLPGHAEDAVTIYLGHGRTHSGRVGDETGFDAYAIRTSAAPNWVSGAKVDRTGKTYTIACTQMHWATEGRRPVRPGTVSEFAQGKFDFAQQLPAADAERQLIKDLLPGPNEVVPGSAKNGHKHDDHDHDHDGHNHKHEHGPHDKRLVPLTVYDNFEPTVKKGRRWAMAIDTSACSGCNACLVACQSENNIPVVGKDQVTRGREMHWIRTDRYYELVDPKGDPDDPLNIKTYFQPVPCQQCEKAPCEVVCPVGATTHSTDGLNDMVYNRCVGTRYCSNNCPYKVRRFNFLFFADYYTESLKLGRNPEVTVRTRGVMEKCTYCVQRIRAAEIDAEREWATRPKDADGRPKIIDGEVVTACQAACPSGAIVFGDLSDPASEVNRWKAEPTNYGLLAELNTMPRTSYLAAVRNPNPEMPALPTKGV
jgi:MoCo/4Fe-4S cofactor protein with predicted Tat translocation signal